MAQTILQLYSQLRRDGYSTVDLSRIRTAYELAIQLYSCRYLASGRLQLDHLVGTASILGNIRAPIELVVAGMLHNAYDNGDFGFGSSRGSSSRKRDRVRRVIGEAAEGLIHRFPVARERIEREGQSSPAFDNPEPEFRNAVLLYLADQLEHHRTLDVLYRADVDQRKQWIATHGEQHVALAERVGYPNLGAEFRSAFDRIVSIEISEEFQNPFDRNWSFHLIPASYRMRFSSRVRSSLRVIFGRIHARFASP